MNKFIYSNTFWFQPYSSQGQNADFVASTKTEFTILIQKSMILVMV